jgi:hypothetical protein
MGDFLNDECGIMNDEFSIIIPHSSMCSMFRRHCAGDEQCRQERKDVRLQ